MKVSQGPGAVRFATVRNRDTIMHYALIALSLLAAAGEESQPPKVRSFGIQLSAAAGWSGAEGSLVQGETASPLSPGLSLLVDVPFPANRNLGLQAGASWVTRGRDFFVDWGGDYSVSQRVQYLTVPLMLRCELPFEGDGTVFRIALRGGLSGDLALAKGGTWTEGGITRDLVTQTTFYAGHRSFNLSLLLGLGLDFGIRRYPSFLFGFDLLFDNHLFDEYDASAQGGNLQYRNTFFGIHLTYQLYATPGPVAP